MFSNSVCFETNATSFETNSLTMEELEEQCAEYVWAHPEEFGVTSESQAQISIQCLVLEKLGRVIRTCEYREAFPGVMQPVWTIAPGKN